GGGLVGGLAAALAGRSRIVALEPERAPTLFRAREAGEPVDVEVGGIAADSLGARRIGSLAWQIAQRHVQDARLLPDEAIRAAQQWLWRELKLAVEPAAALPLAALQCGAWRPAPGEASCLVICGANVDPASLG
ncbi:MAG: pyridoxal-phosphate dependent enzyme, partial [Xenophilus sp.]